MKKPRKPRRDADEPSFDRPRVVVRFGEGVRLRGRGKPEVEIQRAGIGPWDKLVEEFPGLRLSPVFAQEKGTEIRQLTARAAELDPTYKPADFGAFYYVDAPP